METNEKTDSVENFDGVLDAMDDLPAEEKSLPDITLKDFPDEYAVWVNEAKKGREPIRIEVGVTEKNKEGKYETNKISIWHRDAYVIGTRLLELAKRIDGLHRMKRKRK